MVTESDKPRPASAAEVQAEIDRLFAEARGMRPGSPSCAGRPVLISDALSGTPEGTIQWVQLVMAGELARVRFTAALLWWVHANHQGRARCCCGCTQTTLALC